MSGRGTGGFTLLEIVVTLAVLAIVLTITYGVFARTLSQKERTEAASFETATARAVIHRILRDLEAVEPGSATAARRTPTPSRQGTIEASEQYLFLSRNRSEQGVPFDDLAFSATLRKPTAGTLSSSDLGVVRYFVEPDPRAPSNLVLWRETVLSLSGELFDPDAPLPERSIRIVDGLAGLQFRFHDGNEWVEEWDSSDTRSYAPVPHAVEVALALRDEEGVAATYRSAIDLPIARHARPVRGTVAGRVGDGDVEPREGPFNPEPEPLP